MGEPDIEYRGEDLDLLMNAAATVLLATVAAERSGPIAYFAEMTAAGTFLYDARRRYRHNRLIQELYRRHEETEVIDVSEEPVTKETLLRDIDRVDELLGRDEEGMEFRSFLLELAERVARASRSGWFGRRVSEREAEFLTDLRRRLGLLET